MTNLEMLETVEAVIDALGGNGPVGKLTETKPSTISMWKKAQAFPPKYHMLMTGALFERGKTAPASLWGMKLPSEVA